MKFLNWRVRLGIFLILLSALLYFIHYLIFHDPHHIFIFLEGDIAFLPMEILFVVLIIEWAIGEKEKKIMLQKLNMVIGSFFSEVGTNLLSGISEFESNTGKIRNKLIITDKWAKNDFIKAMREIKNYEYDIRINKNDLDSLIYLKDLKEFLVDKREFLLRLLANPNLLEHETFTDLLWAVFHLTEELEKRNDLMNSDNADYDHLAIDIERVYNLLISEWLQYMEHLMNDYPYLFSLAIRTNPFDLDAEVEIPDN